MNNLIETIPFLSFSKMNNQIREELISSFTKFVDNGWYILGNEVRDFEIAYAKHYGTKYCVGVSNGLDALSLSLMALNVGKGDEVILPSNTFIATVLAVSYVGATPVFVEPDIESYNIDPQKIEQAITKSTKVIIPVHLYGQACEMSEIMTIAQKHGIYVLEDNAQAHGATWEQKFTGTWGHINATSFYPGKNLGALGDAGAITTDNADLAERVKMLRNYGSREKYFHEEIGCNHRLDECQAAFLSIKLKYIDEWTIQRQQIAQVYFNLLKNLTDIVLPVTKKSATHVYHLYVIRTKKRDELRTFLSENGVGTLIHYPVPPHLQKAYQGLGYKKGDFPIAETLADTCLSYLCGQA